MWHGPILALQTQSVADQCQSNPPLPSLPPSPPLPSLPPSPPLPSLPPSPPSLPSPGAPPSLLLLLLL